MTKFDKVVTFMSSFLPFLELHSPDRNFTAINVMQNGHKLTCSVEGDYTQYIDDEISTIVLGVGSVTNDVGVVTTVYLKPFTYLYIDSNTSPAAIDAILIKNENINGQLDIVINNMAYQMAIRFSAAFGMTLLDLQDEANYDDRQLSVIAQMCCVYYLQRAVQAVMFNSSISGKFAANLVDTGNSTSTLATQGYFKKAKADVVEVEFGMVSGQDLVTSKVVAAGLSASLDSATFTAMLRNLMQNLHRMANQTMIDHYDFMIDYTWDDNLNDSFALIAYGGRFDDELALMFR
jgi:hypothetical protein